MTQASSCAASHRVSHVTFSPDGKSVAITSSSIGDTLELFDIETGARRWKHSGRGAAFGEVTFSADGRLLAVGGSVPSIAILDTGDGRVVRRIRIRSGSQQWPEAVVGPDGMRLAVALDRKVRVHDAISGDEILSLRLSADAGSVRYSPDGTRIATLGKDGLHVWDAESGQAKATLPVHASTYDMAFGGCSHVLVTAGKDWVIRVWDVVSGVEFRQLDRVWGTDWLTLSDDGGGRVALIGCTDGTLRVWDVMAGRERTRLPIPRGLRVAAVNSDGTKLATGNSRKSVEIWSIATAPSAATADTAADRWCARCGAG